MRADAGCEAKGDGEEKPDYCGIMGSGDALEGSSAIAVLAGAAAGWLDVGGGMPNGSPLLIALGMQPRGASPSAFLCSSGPH